MATFNIKTTADLKRMLQYIEKQTQDSLRLISLEVEKMMKDYIIKALYNAYQPKDYLRSMNYINSLTVKKVTKNSTGELESEIFYHSYHTVLNCEELIASLLLFSKMTKQIEMYIEYFNSDWMLFNNKQNNYVIKRVLYLYRQ